MNIWGTPGSGKVDGLRILGLILIPLILLPGAQSPTDLINNFQNLTKISPITGSPSGNTTEYMTQYMNWLNGMSSGMASLFSQITGTFGLGNLNFFGPLGNSSGNLQESLQRVLNQINGTGVYP
jgi:hypothetical protein